MVDYERGIKLAGQGSWIYTGVGAQLEWALLCYFVNTHIKNGWEFNLVPHMLNYDCGYVAGQFPKFKDEVYWVDGNSKSNGKFILPTAETALVNIHRDEILREDELPKNIFLIHHVIEEKPVVQEKRKEELLEDINLIKLKWFSLLGQINQMKHLKKCCLMQKYS